MKKRIFGVFIMMLALSVAAQDQQEPSGGGENQGQSRRGRGNRGGGPGGGFNREAMQEAMRKVDEQIKEKLPEEYKELEKLSQTDMRASFAKRRELAEKAGIEMPSFGRGRSGNRPEREAASGNRASDDKAFEEWQKAEAAIKEKFPKEYEEIDKLRQTDTAAALVKLRELAEKAEVKLPEGEPPGRNVSPRTVAKLAVARAHRILQRRYPEDYAEYEKLREEDPDAARDKFRTMFKKAGLNSEELKRQVTSHRTTTRVIQVETPVPPQQQQQNRRANNGGGGNNWGGGSPGGWSGR